jgi:hypothetical protein
MTREALIRKVKRNYAKADEATIEAVLNTLQEAEPDERLTKQPLPPRTPAQQAIATSTPTDKFVGLNPTLEQYRKLSFKERAALKRQLQAQNRKWLDEKLSSLKAAWLMVVDGEVIGSGTTLNDYPRTEQIRKLGLQYGKRPFIFINKLFVAIEETGGTWHSTVYANDFYPTVPVAFRNDSSVLEVTADFDTGAASSFADQRLLLSHQIIDSDEDEEAESSEHLGNTFEYVSKPITIEVKLPTGDILSCELTMLCVADWSASPFIRINPRRTMLAGRDLFLNLQPSILLDFATHRTSIYASEAI